MSLDISETGSYSQDWFGFEQAVQNVLNYITYGLENSNGGNDPDLSNFTSPITVLYLEIDGCRDKNTNQRNCTEACADPARVWNDTATLANCMIIPLVASALGRGLLNHTETVINYNISTGSKNQTRVNTAPEIAQDYGIAPVADLDLGTTAPWEVINRCTTAYCNAVSPSGTNCSATSSLGFRADWHIGTWRPALHFNTTLCQDISASFNQDLGGVGMIIAYLLQISLLLAGWLLGTINTAGTAVFVWAGLLITRRSKGSRWRQAQRTQHRVQGSRQAVALNAALVEFQRTQTFFVLAVAVAALIAVNNAAYLQVSSYQQLWNNIAFMSTIGLSGCYPIVLNLLILRKTTNATSSAYLLCISTCCVAISTTLWAYAVLHQPRADQIVFSNGYYLPDCGTEELTNPTWTCVQTYGSYNIDGFSGDGRILAFPLVVLGFLLAEEIKVFSSETEQKPDADKVNVFAYLHSMLELDWEPAYRRISRGYQAASRWSWNRVPTKTKYALGDSTQTVRSWYQTAIWKSQDASSNVAFRYPRAATGAAIVHRKVLTPCYTWTTEVTRKSWTAICKSYTSRNIPLATLDAVYKVVPVLTELGLVLFNALLLVQYARYLGLLNDASWSLGQVISVTIWVPIVVEYAYLLMCGIEEGFEYRLTGPYHVKKDDDGDDHGEEDESVESDDATADTAERNAGGTVMRKISMVKELVDEAVEMDVMEHGQALSSEATFLTPRRSWEQPFDGT